MTFIMLIAALYVKGWHPKMKVYDRWHETKELTQDILERVLPHIMDRPVLYVSFDGRPGEPWFSCYVELG